MGNIKLPNGEIKEDQRQNGARIKLDLADWIKILSTIITAFVVVILGLGQMKWTLNNHAFIISQFAEAIEENKTVSRDNRKDIEALKTDITEIKKDVKELLKRR